MLAKNHSSWCEGKLPTLPFLPLLNDELESIQNWTISNELSTNVDKTKINKNFNKINDNSEGRIKLGEDIRKFKNSCMFLWVNIDKNLNFSLHIIYITSKISKTQVFFIEFEII